MGKKFLFGLMSLCMTLCLAINAEAARQTRDLVFEDEETAPAAKESSIENPQVVAVKATIELNRNGEVSTVSPSHEFQSGDKVKLLYTPNIDGYAYWLAKGSSGNITVLFPSVQTGADNTVARNTEYTIPVKGSFKFDNNPGQEELLCIISPVRIPELDKIIEETSKGQIPAEKAQAVAEVENKNTSKRATRDLVFEDEDEEDVNTKTQVAPQGEPFVAHYILTHK